MLKRNINKIFKLIFSCFMFSYFLVIMIFLLPNAVTLPSHSFRSSIITAIGIDNVDEMIEVSVLTISDVSVQTKLESTKLMSAKGNTVASAIGDLEEKTGRKIRMGHVGYIVISKNFATQNIAVVLNNLIITTKLPSTVSLVLCEDSAKEILTQANTLENGSSYKLREIIQNAFNENFTKVTSLDSFMKGYHSNLGVSTIGYVKLEEGDSNGINSQSEQNSNSEEQNSNSSSASKKFNISFKREHAVFVDGKLKYILLPEEMNGVNWIEKGGVEQLLTINNVITQGLNNSQISFETTSHKVKINSYFANNVPIVEYNIDLGLKVVEIISAEKIQISPNDIFIDDELYEKINNEIKKQFSVTLNKLRQEKTDIINAYSVLYANNYQKFTQFLNNLNDKKDFLSYIQFQVAVNPKFITS